MRLREHPMVGGSVKARQRHRSLRNCTVTMGQHLFAVPSEFNQAKNLGAFKHINACSTVPMLEKGLLSSLLAETDP